jgi:hypothetical protein
MHRSTFCLLAAASAGCHSYEPAPVDLGAHAAAFLARLPDAESLAAARPLSAPHTIDLADGIDREEARWIAICLHPDCRAARWQAGIAEADREHAGTLPDPQFAFGVERILETVPHPWIAGGSLGFSLPLNGRLGLERQLAGARLDERVLAVWLAERAAADNADAAWVRWSTEVARNAQLDTICARLRELAAIAARLEQANVLSHLDARVFVLELTQRELDRAAAADAKALAELEVKQRLGLHPQAPVVFVPSTQIAPHVADAAQRLATLDKSPRVLPARAAHRTAEADLELAVRRQWPDLTLAPGWREEDALPRATLDLSLPLPLFAGNDAAIAHAASARAAAAEALRASLEVATQELAQAELRWQQMQQRRQTITERLLPLVDQQVEDGRRLVELGQLQPLLLLDALSRAHQARMQALDAALQEALAVIALNEHCAAPLPNPDPGEPR